MIPGRGERTGALLAATADYLRGIGALDGRVTSDEDPKVTAAWTFDQIEKVPQDLSEDDYESIVSLIIGRAFLSAVVEDLADDQRRSQQPPV